MVEAAVLDASHPQQGAGAAAAADRLRPLRLLVLVPKPQGVSPGQRFRLEQWAPHLEARHGVTLDFLPFESPGLTRVLYGSGRHAEKAARVAFDFVRRATAVVKARRYDGVIIYRELSLIGPAIYERLLASLNIPIFFDFDDAVWLEGDPGASANGIFSRLHFWGKTSTVCRLASGVFAGNGYLAAYARERNANVFILPTTIELDEYPLQPELEADDPFVVCWTGSTTTLAHFEHARGALERLAASRRTTVRVICNRPPERPIAGAENLFVPWTEQGEAQAIGACHVGIMPLPNTDFTKGKCGLKALQYMATGRPAVLSPVGMNVDLVRSGENGFLAETDDEWVSVLTRLADSPELRKRIGAAGRRTIETGYSAPVVAKSLADAVRETFG